jgi:hypothetical protein
MNSSQSQTRLIVRFDSQLRACSLFDKIVVAWRTQTDSVTDPEVVGVVPEHLLQPIRFALRNRKVLILTDSEFAQAQFSMDCKIVRYNITSSFTFEALTPHQTLARASIDAGVRNPLVSIIVPCYKQAHLLADALTSVEQQTYNNWECIVVDDGSPDDVQFATQPFIKRYPDGRFKLLRKANQGLAEARNSGIAVSCGSFILPLDSDDMLRQDALEKYLSVVRNSEATVAYSLVQTFGAQTEILRPIPYEREKLKQENQLIYSALFPKELWEATKGYRGIVPFGCEDYLFWLDCIELGFKPHLIDEPLFQYRKHSGTSMVDGVNSNREFVFSCAHTAVSHLYTPEELLHKHQIISCMSDEQLQRVEGSIHRYPSQGAPYLWRGLYRFANQQIPEAVNDLELSWRLAECNDWQAAYYLFLLAAKGWAPTVSAHELLLHVMKSCPTHPELPRLRTLIS